MLVFGDFFVLIISLLIFHYNLFFNQFQLNLLDIWQYLLIITITLISFIFTGQYKSLTKYQSSEIIYNQFIKNFIFNSNIFHTKNYKS